MNLFVAAIAPTAPDPAPALQGLLGDLPFLPGRPVETWRAPSGRAAVAWAQHAPADVGGVEYVTAEEARLALFSGRPVLWDGDVPDGRRAIDPRSYLEPAAGWAPRLDGRAVALRYDDASGGFELVTDPLGAYPVFTATRGGTRWVSNNPELLRRLAGSDAWDEAVLASFLGGGWSLSGDPLWRGVRRLAPGAVHRLRPAAEPEREPLPQPVPERFDADRAAALLVALTRALADWPGRPNVVPVTGGRDSRLVLAAALRAGFEFEATTGGPRGHPDVEVGRRLCEVAGIPHVPLAGDPHGDMWTRPRRAAELVQLTAGGTASVSDAAGFPLGPREGPLVLWHSGQGGEVARGYYGTARGLDGDALADRLYRAFVARRPGRTELLGKRGERLVRDEVGAFVDERLAAGAALEDVPDLFYLHRRMGTWAGPTHACVEWVKDTTSPLWSARLVPDLLGLPADERARELFHLRVLERLAPELVDVPFAGGGGWPGRRSALARRAARARSLARKGRAEALRRAGGALAARRGAPAAAERSAGAPPRDPFASVHAETAAAVAAQPEHPAWAVLDRGRVERLLARDPASLDEMSRYYVWRLAQAFWLAPPHAAPGQEVRTSRENQAVRRG
jgi:hypothetical protein